MNKGFVSRRYIRIVALMMVLLLVLSGCNKDKKQEKVDVNSTVVFQYGDNIVTLGEV